MPAAAWPGCSRHRAHSPSSTVPPWVIASTAATTVRRHVRPIGRRPATPRRRPPTPETSRGWPRLGRLDLADDAVLARVGRWYIPKRHARYVRRNALVALGNVGSPTDARVVAMVERFAAGPDPLLREHAEWARRSLTLKRCA